MTDAAAHLPTAEGRSTRRALLLSGIWLVFLADPVGAAWQRAWGPTTGDRVAGWAGLLALAAFVTSYLAAFAWIRRQRATMLTRVPAPAAFGVLAWMVALMAVAATTVGQSAMAAAVYIAVVGVMALRPRVALLWTAALALSVEVSGRTVPGWEQQPSLTLSVCAAAFAMWGVSQMILRNMDLLRAREENARLAVDEERNRFARDLHDILGHSLTVITVKAELANRLLDVDHERARAELADLERLSRDALADVRRAVQGYREITLPGELARAREALRAAGIDAEVPSAADEVAGELRDLFAWTVREGVTNVIRHSSAQSCAIRLGPRSVEVRDDGRGCQGTPEGAGHGLSGLRERAAAAGAVVVTRVLEPRGFALEVSAQ